MRVENPHVDSNSYPWINPVGGLGDMLMVSSVLKQVYDRDPAKRYNLVKRTRYLTFLQDHPAIATRGFPAKGAHIVGVDYWSMEKLGAGSRRAFQGLARAFGLPTPVEERLYIPGEIPEDILLTNFVPWKGLNIAIAPSSDSRRKITHPSIWHRIADLLLAGGYFVVQVGRGRDVHISNTYSLLGLTTPRELIRVLKKVDAVITADSFLMHAAHLVGIPTVAIWGASHHQIYGYSEQFHIQVAKTYELGMAEECLGPDHRDKGRLYGTPCPMGDRHCLFQIKPEEVYEAIPIVLCSHSSRS
jgi:ADP-heptose:LPS heptosyltransferase